MHDYISFNSTRIVSLGLTITTTIKLALMDIFMSKKAKGNNNNLMG